MSHTLQDDYNTAVFPLEQILKDSLDKNTSWRGMGFRKYGDDGEFEPGTADLCPGWFMSRREVSSQSKIPIDIILTTFSPPETQ
jgi:hypothetical protein